MRTKTRILTTIMLGIGILSANAQNVALVTAYNYLQDKDYDKAAQAIEPATTNAKTAIKEKTFRYRGQIYQQIAISDDEALQSKYPNAVELAVESFLKAIELDTKKSYYKDNRKSLAGLQGMSLNSGNDYFGQKNYAKAISSYQTCERIAEAFGMVDTNAVFNQALAYDQDGRGNEAMQKYQQLIDMGYTKPDVFRYLASTKKQAGDVEGAIEIAKQGATMHPDSKELILDLMAYAIEGGKSDVAEETVGLAIEKDPSNPALHSIIGSMHDAKAQAAADAGKEEEMNEWYAKAEASYKKSIELDENYFDAYYNVGVLYNNRAAYIYEKIKDIKSDTEYAKAKKEADDVYLSAVPFFEKAHAIDATDQQSIAQLVKLYGKTGDEDKYNEMKAKLAALSK